MPKRLSNDRKFPDGTGPRPDFSSLKREEATQRQADHDSLTVAQKLAKLDAKFGVGVGAKKERARLTSVSEKKAAAPVVEATEVSDEASGKKMKAKDRRRQEKKGADHGE